MNDPELLAAYNALGRAWPPIRAHIEAELNWQFMTLADREMAGDTGNLPPLLGGWRDVERLEASDPRRPDNRQRRMEAADLIRFVVAASPVFVLSELSPASPLRESSAKEQEAYVEDLLLGQLHRSAFDENAAVRLSIVQTLGWLGSRISLNRAADRTDVDKAWKTARRISLAVLRQLAEADHRELMNSWTHQAAEEAIAVLQDEAEPSDTEFIRDPVVI